MEPWVGQTVSISTVWVAFRGEQVRGIRVMPAGSGRDDLDDDFIPY
jgi:hypothetical protein